MPIFSLINLAYKCLNFLLQIAHSAYPDSPLGPDAFHEYESLLVQDYDEVIKKSGTKSRRSEDIFQENMTSDDDGWSQFSPRKEEIARFEAGLKARESYAENPIGHTEDIGKELAVSVHHFPMILCPFSPQVFVLPSEGSVAEAYISSRHEDALSSGLPPISTGIPSDGDDVLPGETLTAHFLYHLATKVKALKC